MLVDSLAIRFQRQPQMILRTDSTLLALNLHSQAVFQQASELRQEEVCDRNLRTGVLNRILTSNLMLRTRPLCALGYGDEMVRASGNAPELGTHLANRICKALRHDITLHGGKSPPPTKEPF